MPKIVYLPKRFTKAHDSIIKRANVFLEAYAEAGIQITLRTLYYRFVAKGWITNEEKSYKRLGKIIRQARLAGRIDWEHMEDRMRSLSELQHFEGAEDALKTLSRWYHVDMWASQKYRPEVWIEKDALGGIFKQVCERYDIPFFCCRGYTSLTEMWRASLRLRKNAEEGKINYIILFGDHDPSGIDMSRDIENRLTSTFDAPIEFTRVALNMDQVLQYEPPPNPTKLKDTRAPKYVEQFGRESWECDSLEPFQLRDLVTHHVDMILDKAQWKKDEKERERVRTSLVEIADDWEGMLGYKGAKELAEKKLESAILEFNKQSKILGDVRDRLADAETELKTLKKGKKL